MNTGFNEKLDLVVSRVMNVPPELIWRAWAEPEHFVKWWAPAPIVTTVQQHEFYPGGAFDTTMRDEAGNEYPVKGCFLEVVEYERIVFTDALEGGWRPTPEPFFTAFITLEDHPEGTLYTARAMHKDEANRQKHAEMGFDGGWRTTMNQLAEVAATLAN
jgi:uncharacterized protein YndB with AHSA1/START domain